MALVTWSHLEGDIVNGDVYTQLLNISVDRTPTLIGSSFRVNTFSSKELGYADTAGFGNSVGVTWSSLDQDGSSYGIFAQNYRTSASGPGALIKVGTEFRVNTFTSGWQGSPSVVMLSENRMMIVWHSFDQDFSS